MSRCHLRASSFSVSGFYFLPTQLSYFVERGSRETDSSSKSDLPFLPSSSPPSFASRHFWIRFRYLMSVSALHLFQPARAACLDLLGTRSFQQGGGGISVGLSAAVHTLRVIGQLETNNKVDFCTLVTLLSFRTSSFPSQAQLLDPFSLYSKSSRAPRSR